MWEGNCGQPQKQLALRLTLLRTANAMAYVRLLKPYENCTEPP